MACWALGCADPFWHPSVMPLEGSLPGTFPASFDEDWLALAAQCEQRGRPPIENWHPTRSISSHMRILRDGTWLHEGAPISRPAMVRLFASMLKREEDGQHWLITPECRQSVEVEDTAFVATDLRLQNETLLFRINTGEWVEAGPDRKLVANTQDETAPPLLQMPHGCSARLNRSTWLQLVDIALEQSGDAHELAVTSKGIRFVLAAL